MWLTMALRYESFHFMLKFLEFLTKTSNSLEALLTPNKLNLHLFLKVYDPFKVYEHWVDLKNLFFINGTRLGFLDLEHNGEI